MSDYLPVKPSIIKELDISVYHLSYYLKWDPQEVYYYAAEKTGFKSYGKNTRQLQ